ncbi:MAG: DUF6775 family putative metallopeptidase [bacterium]
MPRPSFIHIYNQGASSALNIHLMAQYLREKTGLDVDIRGNLIPTHGDTQKLVAEEFAGAKIVDPQKKGLNPDPLSAEIEYESRLLSAQKPSGLLYDGFCVQEIFRKLIPQIEHNLTHAHIIFTSRLFGTYEDNRYHARIAVFGIPSIISTTGIVEAPAKPREFYLKKELGQDLARLKEEFKGRFIDYDDPRLTEVMKGYVMQALFYHAFGNPFCDDPECRLYNAHWQEEVIKAQLEAEYEFCPLHEQALWEAAN